MQAAIVANMMERTPPDIYIKPELAGIRLLDLHRREEIIEGVADDVKEFQKQLEKKLRP